MLKPVALLFITALAAFGGYKAYYHLALATGHNTHAMEMPELEWLRKEFDVPDEQFRQIEKLHREYAPLCAEMCAKVSASQANLQAIVAQDSSPSPELDAAVQQCAQLEAECRTSMLAHIDAVGELMAPEARTRYVQHMTHRLFHPMPVSGAIAQSHASTGHDHAHHAP